MAFAKNTLTQRTIGPACTGSTSLDVSNMKDGDFAGLCLLQKNYGLIAVRIIGSNKTIVMINASTGKPEEVQSVLLDQNVIYLKAECDFMDKKDIAHFFYSLDGKNWTEIGTRLRMAYTLPHFMGYRFGLFNYATKTIGGFADFDYFRIRANTRRNKTLYRSLLVMEIACRINSKSHLKNNPVKPEGSGSNSG